MTAPTTRPNAPTTSVRNNVMTDLWNTVHNLPYVSKYTFSADVTLGYFMHKFQHTDHEYLNSDSEYTYGMIRVCEWEEFAVKCQQKEIIYQCMLLSRNDRGYTISNDMYSDDDLPDTPLNY
jgi:hypothetical protein